MLGSFAGKLLLASPQLLDPNFRRSVVLVCVHDENGALGLVLNRPLPVSVPDALPDWGDHASEPAVMFAGGPVEPSLVNGLGFSRGTMGAEWTPVSRGVGLIDLSRGPDAVAAEVERLRLFVGYSGWGPSQLEAEVMRDDWFVVEPFAGDAFTLEPHDLWRDVLRRQPDPLVMYSTFPLDVSSN